MSVMQEVDDNRIIEKYLSGDIKAFDLLVEKHLQSVYALVVRLVGPVADAEDLCQDIFVKAWKKIATYDSSRNFKVWLFGIARNSAIDFLRKKKSLPFSSFENDDGENPLIESLADTEKLPDEIFEQQDLRDKLTSAISELPVADQEAVLWHYQDQLSFREIGEITGESVNTVKSRYQRALQKLKKKLL